MKPSVLISVPNLGWIHKHVVFSLLRLFVDPRITARVICPTWRPLETAQQKIVNEWIDESREDFWLSIDADNPPIGNPLDRIADDLDVVGFPTPVWHFTGEQKGERPIYWNVYKRKGDEGYSEWPEKSGLQRVDAVGLGCFLMARRVMERPELRYGAFVRKLNTDGTVDRGNDISFCERAREAGVALWADFDRPCRHFAELELTEVIRAYQELEA